MVVVTNIHEQAEIERAERYLEVKAQSIAFKRSVARELEKAGLKFQEDYCEGIYVTDFLVEHKGKGYALECKFNVQRDMEKTVRIARMLKEKLDCFRSFIVVPSFYEIIFGSNSDDIVIADVSAIIKRIINSIEED